MGEYLFITVAFNGAERFSHYPVTVVFAVLCLRNAKESQTYGVPKNKH